MRNIYNNDEVGTYVLDTPSIRSLYYILEDDNHNAFDSRKISRILRHLIDIIKSLNMLDNKKQAYKIFLIYLKEYNITDINKRIDIDIYKELINSHIYAVARHILLRK